MQNVEERQRDLAWVGFRAVRPLAVLPGIVVLVLLLKVLWWDGQGLCLFAKRLERGRFIWPQAKDGSVVLTAAQLSMLLEGIDWRAPRRSWAPEAAG
jgi:hypothetical protein